MDILDYLRENQNANSNYKKPQESHHNKLLRRIQDDPSIIGVNNVEHIFREVALEGGDILAIADLVAVTNREVCVIEARVYRCDRQRGGHEKLNFQLRKAYEFFKKQFGISAKCIGAYSYVQSKRIYYHKLRRPVEDLLLPTI